MLKPITLAEMFSEYYVIIACHILIGLSELVTVKTALSHYPGGGGGEIPISRGRGCSSEIFN